MESNALALFLLCHLVSASDAVGQCLRERLVAKFLCVWCLEAFQDEEDANDRE